MIGGKRYHARMKLKRAKQASWKRISHQHIALGADSAQVCSTEDILGFIPAKRESHLRVKNQKKY